MRKVTSELMNVVLVAVAVVLGLILLILLLQFRRLSELAGKDRLDTGPQSGAAHNAVTRLRTIG